MNYDCLTFNKIETVYIKKGWSGYKVVPFTFKLSETGGCQSSLYKYMYTFNCVIYAVNKYNTHSMGIVPYFSSFIKNKVHSNHLIVNIESYFHIVQVISFILMLLYQYLWIFHLYQLENIINE